MMNRLTKFFSAHSLLASHMLSYVTTVCNVWNFMALCVWDLFINVDGRWVAGCLSASNTLGCVEYNLYYMLTTDTAVSFVKTICPSLMIACLKHCNCYCHAKIDDAVK